MRCRVCCASSNSLPLVLSVRRLAHPGLARIALAALAALAAPAQARDAVVYAAGDIAACRGRSAQFAGALVTAERMAADMAKLAALPGAPAQVAVLTLGDNTYPVGKLAEFTDCYGPTWGRFKAITYPAPGNHEYAGGYAAGYFSYFGAQAGKGYYSFQLGDWRLYSLNSNLGPAAHQAQLEWLKAELAANPSRCALAYWHHPLFSSGGHGSIVRMREAWRLLQAAGAELVLAGHDHDYERFAPQDAEGVRNDARGMRQFVVGTGGAQLSPFLFSKPNSEMRDNSRTGVLRLRLGKDGYDWEFLEASYDGYGQPPAPDRGNGLCH
jgi:3',5'-cyclic AMP phosphodiesterase CpdA